MAFLAEEIDALDRKIQNLIRDAHLTEPYELLQTIPGIRSRASATILAESGPDMKQFPSASHFSSWSGVAPANNESAGKRKRTDDAWQSAHQDGSGRVSLVGFAHEGV